MNKKKDDRELKFVCEELFRHVNCDFIGIAFQQSESTDIQWHTAVGNRNDKYKRIIVRYGKGIAGKVISTGSSLEISGFPETATGKVLDYPIMLAENLLYAFAVPILLRGIPKGVLLVGNRTSDSISLLEQMTVKEAAEEMEDMLFDFFGRPGGRI